MLHGCCVLAEGLTAAALQFVPAPQEGGGRHATGLSVEAECLGAWWQHVPAG